MTSHHARAEQRTAGRGGSIRTISAIVLGAAVFLAAISVVVSLISQDPEDDGGRSVQSWPNQPADSPVCGKTQKVIATPTEWEPVTEKGEAGVKCRWWLRKVETSNRNMRGLLAVRPDGNDELVQQYGFRPDGTYARLNLEAFGNVDTLGFKSNEPYPIRLFVYWRPE